MKLLVGSQEVNDSVLSSMPSWVRTKIQSLITTFVKNSPERNVPREDPNFNPSFVNVQGPAKLTGSVQHNGNLLDRQLQVVKNSPERNVLREDPSFRANERDVTEDTSSQMLLGRRFDIHRNAIY
jgi:hypothetical protein